MPRVASDQGVSIQQQLARIRRVGDRLRSTLRAVVANLPAESRGISSMARHLKVHKATCQRLVEGLAAEGDGASSLTRLPGVDGLRLILKAAKAKGVPEPVLEQARAAVDGFDELLTSLDVTQTGLNRLIAALGRTGGKQAQASEQVALTHRRDLFRAARSVTGEQQDVKSVVLLVRPDPADPALLRTALLATMVGVERELFARPITPFVLGAVWSQSAQSSAAAPSSSMPVPSFELVPQFSSAGLRGVPLESGSGRTAQVVEFPGSEASSSHTLGPADVSALFVGSTKSNPTTDHDARLVFGARIAHPTRLLVMDVYMAADLAALARPVAGAYALSAPAGDTAEGAPERCWHERFPESPAVQIAPGAAVAPPADGGSGVAVSVAPGPHAFARQTELANYAFEREAIPAAMRQNMVRYRVVVEYPLWQSEYRMYLVSPELRGE